MSVLDIENGHGQLRVSEGDDETTIIRVYHFKSDSSRAIKIDKDQALQVFNFLVEQYPDFQK
jgi:hypothetical protein